MKDKFFGKHRAPLAFQRRPMNVACVWCIDALCLLLVWLVFIAFLICS